MRPPRFKKSNVLRCIRYPTITKHSSIQMVWSDSSAFRVILCGWVGCDRLFHSLGNQPCVRAKDNGPLFTGQSYRNRPQYSIHVVLDAVVGIGRVVDRKASALAVWSVVLNTVKTPC